MIHGASSLLLRTTYMPFARSSLLRRAHHIARPERLSSTAAVGTAARQLRSFSSTRKSTSNESNGSREPAVVDHPGKTIDATVSEPPLPSSSTLPADPASPPSPAVSASASSYLFDQALLEEAEEAAAATTAGKRPRKPVEIDPDAWTGEEPQRRALERILNDSYKPLRIKGYVKKIPQPSPLPNRLFDAPAIASKSTDPPSSTPKHPWEYTFVTPNANKPPAIRFLASTLHPNRVINVTKQERLAKARETSLDYGLHGPGAARVMVPDEGASNGAQDGSGGRASNKRVALGGMRAWNGFVEDKIEQARRDGQFRHLSGRGKPIPRANGEEDNSVVSRDEFLMNRIVKRQGVAPPWVELQQELNINLGNFRTELRSTWVRRATRMRSLDAITSSTLTEIKEGWRDVEWEARELAYHQASIVSLNSIIRRYNVIAPYHVRRGTLSLAVELTSCIRDSSPIIEEELRKRMMGISEEVKKKVVEVPVVEDNVWRAFKRAVGDIFA